MSEHAPKVDRLLELAGAALSNNASQDDLSELDRMLFDDEHARLCYLDYCYMHVALRVESRARRSIQAAQKHVSNRSAASPSTGLAAAMTAMPSALPPSVVVSDAMASPHYSFSGWPVAYLIATCVVAIGIAIAAITHVGPSTVATNQQRSVEQRQSVPDASVVGRITGMVDCVWSVVREDKLPSPASGRVPGGEGGLDKNNVLCCPIRLG